MKGPKVVLIGAGSVFFGMQTIWSMVKKEGLNNGTLALVDPDEKKLGWLEKVARRAIDATGVDLKLQVATNHRKVLKGADFVTMAFARDGVKLRGLDADISTKYGMIMCSADTIGPGGTMRTLREVPVQTNILKDVEKICPEAWIVNWINPTAAMGIASMRHFPNLKSLAICDGPHNPRFDNDLIVDAGLAKSAEKITDALRSRVKIRSGGVNHFNWVVEMTYKGRDVTGRLKQKLLDEVTKADHADTIDSDKSHRINEIALMLTQAVGYVPKCVGHTQEYLPFFQGHDKANKKDVITLKKWRIDLRRGWMRTLWKEMRDTASGKRPIEDFLEKTTPDHASDIIEAMWLGLDKRFYINTPNRGAVTNMPDDAYLELLCVVDMNDVRPLPFGEMPRPLHGYCQRVLDEHELAVEAAMTCDRDTLLKAFLASMVAVSIPDSKACMEEMLRRERAYLPKAWFKKARRN